MRFAYSAQQLEIRDTARALLGAAAPSERVRELVGAARYDDELWSQVVELGWLGITVPAADDGAGLGLVELAAVQEELGAVLAPLPFLSVTAAIVLVEHAGSELQRERWIPGLLAGTVPATVGFAGAGAVAPDAVGAALVIVVDGQRARLFEADAVSATPAPTLDLTRRYGALRIEGPGEELPGDVAGALARVRVALAAESVGVAQRALDLAVAHAKDREQFGRPIGAFQAVAHRCVAMLRQVTGARNLTLYAAHAADRDPGRLGRASLMAAAAAAEAGWKVPGSAIQVHGGIGFTWEHDCHLLLRRGRVNEKLYGSARELRELVAEQALADATS